MVNLSFSFRTPSTSSLAPEGHRVETASGRYGNKNEFAMKRRQKTTNRGNENSYRYRLHHLLDLFVFLSLRIYFQRERGRESVLDTRGYWLLWFLSYFSFLGIEHELEGEYEIRDVNERPSNRPNINSLV